MSAANIFFIILLFEEGLRVCNDAVLLDFSVVLRELLFLSCGIAVLQNQAVCGIWNFRGMLKRFSVVYVILCGV